MMRENSVGMPMDPQLKLVPNPQDNVPNYSHYSMTHLGQLQFVGNTTCPNIACPVNKLAAFTTNPSMEHYRAVKQILRYLQGSKNLGMTYHKSQDDLFYRYADAAFVNNYNLKSTTG
jgi:hypothetical protein